MRRRGALALAELGAAAPLGAVVLLALNDHQWKRLFHDAVTGKLSDVAICFFLPLLVSAALGLVTAWSGRQRLIAGAFVAGAVFTALELSDVAGALFVRATVALGLGGVPLTRDPTDLLALACVPLAVVYGRRRLEAVARDASPWRSVTGALVMVSGSLALVATTEPAPAGCGAWSAPVVFQAEQGCGPGGLLVVDGTYGVLELSNAAALGLPPFAFSGACGSSGVYRGGACPITLDQGGWEVTVDRCPSCDGGSGGGDGGDAGAACSPATTETCRAELEGGELWFSCGGGDGAAPTCRSRLTVASP